MQAALTAPLLGLLHERTTDALATHRGIRDQSANLGPCVRLKEFVDEDVNPTDDQAGGVLSHENRVRAVGQHTLQTRPDLLLRRRITQLFRQAAKRRRVAWFNRPDQRRPLIHGSHGNFFASGFRFSFWAVMNSFASSVM